VRGISGSFQRALEGIGHLTEAGLRPQIIFTVMRANREQMPEVVRLAEKLGAGAVKFNIVQPSARGEQMHEMGATLSIEELIALGSWVENELSWTTRLPIYFNHPPAFRPLSRMIGRSGDGCTVCGIRGILAVLADGSYALCGIGTSEPGLVFGHSAHDLLVDVWQKHPVLQELRAGLPDKLRGICRTCLLKSICLGNCLAQNYYWSKDLWSPYWYCQEADRLGIFPASRKIFRS
jgi:SynChlorMet cassette radical SAM/SPASM protein ScmF